MAWNSDQYYFEKAVKISQMALDGGNEPFGALLVDGEGNILLEQGNRVGDLHDATAHDSLELARTAGRKYDAEFLSQCTLYATIEPCFMCFGGVFWANIGHVKYAMRESDLNAMFGGDPLISIHTADITGRIGKDISVEGPYEPIVGEVKKVIQQWMDNF